VPCSVALAGICRIRPANVSRVTLKVLSLPAIRLLAIPPHHREDFPQPPIRHVGFRPLTPINWLYNGCTLRYNETGQEASIHEYFGSDRQQRNTVIDPGF
jgi:hypothetical protein